MAVSRRTKFVLLALRALCASADRSGAYFLMSFNAGNNNDPENFDHIAIAWVVGAVVMLCVAVGSVVVLSRSKARKWLASVQAAGSFEHRSQNIRALSCCSEQRVTESVDRSQPGHKNC